MIKFIINYEAFASRLLKAASRLGITLTIALIVILRASISRLNSVVDLVTLSAGAPNALDSTPKLTDYIMSCIVNIVSE